MDMVSLLHEGYDKRSAVREAKLVVAKVKDVTFIDALVVDSHALVVDAVRRAEILNIKGPISTNHRGMLARNIPVLDGQVRGLRATTDDELILLDRNFLTVENKKERPRSR